MSIDFNIDQALAKLGELVQALRVARVALVEAIHAACSVADFSMEEIDEIVAANPAISTIDGAIAKALGHD